MNETSKLSIVVDVSNAQQKLKDFTRQLNEAKKAGDQLGSSASNSSQGLNNQAQSANKAQLEANKLAISNKKVEAQNNRTSSSIYGLLSAENRAIQSQNNLQASAVKLVTAGKQQEMQNNRTASSAAQLVVSNQRIAITAEQLATAQFKTVTASNQAAASNNRLSVSAIQVSTANNRLLTSAAQTAAAQTRETIATTNLARANWSLVTAATGAATAEQRLALQTSNAAAAALRAQREAVNLAAAQARLAAQADRAAGAMNGANAASRGLYGSMSKLYTLMNSGLAVVVGLGFIKDAAEMQNLNNQVRLVTTSNEEYLGVKQQINKIANTNYNSIAATTSLYQKSARALGNLGKTQQEALQFTNAISLAMRVGGRSAGEQAAALLQLGQAMGAGVIMGDEFRSISENAPILLDLVAKRMGVMKGELKALSAEGKITAEIMYDAVVENEAMLDKIAKGMPLTMGQAFIVASNKYREMVDTFMNGTGGLSDKISGLLVGISNNFTTIANTVKVAGVLAFVSFASSVNVATASMKLLNIVMGLNPLVRIAMLVLAVGTAFYGLNDVLDTTMLVFNDLMSVIGTGLNGLMDLAGAVAFNISQGFKNSANEGDVAYQGFFDNTEKGFAGFLQGTSRMIAAATSTLAGFFQWIGNGFWQALRVAGNAFIWLGNQAKSIVTKAGKTITDLINEAINGINFLANKANALLDKTPAPWRFKVIGEVEWRNPNYQDTPYFAITGKTLGENIGRNLDILMPAVDNYYSKLAARVKAGRDKVDLSGDIGTGLIDPSSPAGMAAAEARRLAEEEKGKGKDGKGKGSGTSEGIDTSGYLQYANQNSTRNLKISDDLAKRLSFLEDAGIKLVITSGGQPAKGSGGKRVGSTAHDGGMAADGRFVKDGRVLSALNPNDMPILRAIVEEAAARGITGIGTDYMGATVKANKELFHLGIQNTPSTWGKGESSKNSPNWLKESFIAGRKRQKDDSFLGKYDARQQSVIDEENKKLEEQLKLQSELRAQYGSEDLRLSMDLQKEFAKIASSGLSTDEQDRMAVLAQQDKDRKLAVYEKGLQDQLVALTEYQRTERYLIEQARKDEKFKAVNNENLARPENAKVLQDTLDAIDVKYDYDIQRYEMTLDKQKREMYSFRATERDLLKDGYDDQISDAMLMYDELKDYRVAALTEEQKYRLELFDLGQAQQMLELKKSTMTEMGYIKAKYDLERKLAGLSNDSPEIKAAQEVDAKKAFDNAQKAVRDKVMGDYDSQGRELYGISDKYEALKAAWQAANDIAKAAYDEGFVEKEEYYERLESLDRNYLNNQNALMLSGYASTFGVAGDLLKAFGQEQSFAYKAMFAAQKAFTFASVILSGYEAVSKAYASAPFPYNVVPVAKALSETGIISAAVTALSPQGFKQGGYTGNIGVNEVAGAVHGQEYVFDAKATREIGVGNLEAIRSGKAVGGDVNVTVNNMSSARVETQDDGNGNIIMTIRDEVKRSWSNLSNPNSFESKQVNRNVQAPRRR